MTLDEVIKAGVALLGVYFAMGCCMSLVVMAIALAFSWWAHDRKW